MTRIPGENNNRYFNEDAQRAIQLSFKRQHQRLVSALNHFKTAAHEALPKRTTAERIQKALTKKDRDVSQHFLHAAFRRAPLIYETAANLTALTRGVEEFKSIRSSRTSKAAIKKRFGLKDIMLQKDPSPKEIDLWVKYSSPKSTLLVFSEEKRQWSAYFKKADLSFLAGSKSQEKADTESKPTLFEKIEISPSSPLAPELAKAAAHLTAEKPESTFDKAPLKRFLETHLPFASLKEMERFKNKLITSTDHWRWIYKLNKSHIQDLAADKVTKSQQAVYLIRDLLLDPKLFTEQDIIALANFLHREEVFQIEYFIRTNIDLSTSEEAQLDGIPEPEDTPFLSEEEAQRRAVEREDQYQARQGMLNSLISSLAYVRDGVILAFEKRINLQNYKAFSHDALIRFGKDGMPIFPGSEVERNPLILGQPGASLRILSGFPEEVRSLVHALKTDKAFFSELETFVKEQPDVPEAEAEEFKMSYPQGIQRTASIAHQQDRPADMDPQHKGKHRRIRSEFKTPEKMARGVSAFTRRDSIFATDLFPKTATQTRRGSILMQIPVEDLRKQSEVAVFKQKYEDVLRKPIRRYSAGDVPPYKIRSVAELKKEASSLLKRRRSVQRGSKDKAEKIGDNSPISNESFIYGALSITFFGLMFADLGITATVIFLMASLCFMAITLLTELLPEQPGTSHKESLAEDISVITATPSPTSSNNFSLSPTDDNADSPEPARFGRPLSARPQDRPSFTWDASASSRALDISESGAHSLSNGGT